MEKKEKKKGITVRFTETEYSRIKNKSDMYGFRTVTEYLRYVSIHEKVLIEDISGKREICGYFETLRKDLTREEKALRDAIPNISSTIEEREHFEGVLERIINERKLIERQINDILFRTVSEVSSEDFATYSENSSGVSENALESSNSSEAFRKESISEDFPEKDSSDDLEYEIDFSAFLK